MEAGRIGHAAPRELKTARLRLRPLRGMDAGAMAALLVGDPAAVVMTERVPLPCTEAAAREWIALRTGPEEHAFALTMLEDGSFAGCMGFRVMGLEGGLGYWLGRAYWGQGLATEAGEAVLGHARDLGLAALVAETFEENAASVRVLEKLGFAETVRVERDLPQRGGLRRLRQFRVELRRPE